MTTRKYNISMQGKSFEESFNQFNKLYADNKPNELIQSLNVHGTDVRIYNINNLAIILSRYPNKNFFNNLDFIGTKRLINKTIDEIQNKGFKLEEISNK